MKEDEMVGKVRRMEEAGNASWRKESTWKTLV